MRTLGKHVWAIHLVTITACAFFAARATGRLVSGLLGGGPTSAPSRQARPVVAPPEESAPPRTIEPIVSRNIFCSSCERTAVSEGPTGAGGEAPVDTGPVRTSLKVQLLATLVSDDPSTSLACIFDPATNHTGVYGIGDKPAEGASIIEIDARQVRLLNGGRQELLALEGGAPGGEGGATTASPQLALASPSELKVPEPMAGLESLAGGIKRLGASKYSIDRNAYRSLPDLMSTSAKMIPRLVEGKPAGFTIYGQPGSVPSLLGLFNGDVLQSINGRTLTTPEQTLEVLRGLGNTSQFSLTFVRKGVPLTHEYNLQ